eukprot:TRINITY_DN3234_c0_g1_i3.p1 TRINITY_DN3234_c0_g1~~TRINITY_DN3234_c0_g1_i3.p1  ORF type:complete len:1264 (+),score=198.05 TRINITY_DN3234_c0_g1_i3:183-3974(+)
MISYVVLYTKQKTQKQKRWNDGFLEFRTALNKIVLKDENNITLDSQFVKPGKTIEIGEDIEFQGFLVTVESEKTTTTVASPPKATTSTSVATTTRPIQFKSNHLNNSHVLPAKRLPSVKPTNAILPDNKRANIESNASRSVDDVISMLLGEGGSTQEESFQCQYEEEPEYIESTEEQLIESPTKVQKMATMNSIKRDAAPYRRRVGLGGGTGLRKEANVVSTPHFSNVQKKEEVNQPAVVSRPHFSGGSQSFDRRRAPEKVDDKLPLVQRLAAKIQEVEEQERALKAQDELIYDIEDESNVVETFSPPKVEPPQKRLHPATISKSEHKLPASNKRMAQSKLDTWVSPQKSSEENEYQEDDDELLSILSTVSDGKNTVKKVVQSEKRKQLLKVGSQRLMNTTLRLENWGQAVLFPNDAQCEEMFTKHGKPPQRLKVIPNSFSSLQDYKQAFGFAIVEELQLQLLQLAHRFRCLCQQTYGSETNSGPSCSHGPAVLRTVKKEGKNKGKQFWSCPKPMGQSCGFTKWINDVKPGDIVKTSVKTPKKMSFSKADETNFRAKGIPLYINCEIIRSSGSKKEKSTTKPALYIKLSSKESSSAYTKDDIWIISNNPQFYDDKDNFVIIATSKYHSLGRSQMLEIAPLNPSRAASVTSQEGLYAIRGMNISMDLACINNLLVLSDHHPLIPSLLQSTNAPISSYASTEGAMKRRKFFIDNKELVARVCEETIVEYRLNEDQAVVLRNVISQLGGDHESKVLLVHGVFGSGKSTLVCVIIICLSRIGDAVRQKSESEEDEPSEIPDLRCLVAASTNTAVDRILQGLLETDFSDFIRIGSVRRIAKPILRFTLVKLEKSASKSDKEEVPTGEEALRDLKSMLVTEKLSPSERKDVLGMIEELQSGKMEQRMKRLNEVKVVGATCASTVFSVLESSAFPIVILDECSQMIEPLSLLPIAKFQSEYMIAVGDPLQLPPQLSTTSVENNKSDSNGLEKTLFTRLAATGNKPILLRTQYRCHPSHSKIANTLFYEGRLIDGISAQDRSALVDKLPPLLFVDCERGHEKMDFFGSYFNEFEAKVIVQLLRTLIIKYDIEARQIGVITLYKAQAAHIHSVFAQLQAKAKADLAAKPNVSGKSELLESNDEDDDMETNDEDFQKDVVKTVVNTAKEEEEHQDWRFSQVVDEVQISTVDAFQGAEKEIIILATSRTSGLGFIDSPNRMTVALTRAKRHLIITGKKHTLETNTTWNTVIRNCFAFNKGIQMGEHLLVYQDFE